MRNKPSLRQKKRAEEELIHLDIASFLKNNLQPGALWTTVENSNQQGGSAGLIKQIKLKAKGVRSGWPDIQIFFKHSYSAHIGCLFIELKSRKGSQSDSQAIFETQCVALGLEYLLVKPKGKFVSSYQDRVDCVKQVESALVRLDLLKNDFCHD